MYLSLFAPGSRTEPSRNSPTLQRTQIGAPLLARGRCLVATLSLFVGAPLMADLTSIAAASDASAAAGARLAALVRGPLPWPGAPCTEAAPPAAGLERRLWRVGEANPDHDDDYEYRLPYADGVTYRVLQSYGSPLTHRGDEHYTVDFGMPEGTPVHAAREGIVALTESRNRAGCGEARCAAFANFVVILHADGTTGEYFHLAPGGVLVRDGAHVARGQRIGLSGNTGFSSAPHLHFGVYRRSSEGHLASLEVRFRSRNGIVGRPRAGSRYENLPLADPSLAPTQAEAGILRGHVQSPIVPLEPDTVVRAAAGVRICAAQS
jgi:murein DD-endopeptidase MepM/ murein hydrolase activator NlpD